MKLKSLETQMKVKVNVITEYQFERGFSNTESGTVRQDPASPDPAVFLTNHRRDIFHRHPHNNTDVTKLTLMHPDCHLLVKKADR